MSYAKRYKKVDEFEKVIAEFAGSKYAVAVDSCTNALFLCCKYKRVTVVSIPRFTYPGVACSIKHAGGKIFFTNTKWKGAYMLAPHKIVDSALRFREGMYIKGSLYCLSFHWKKHLPIGRGGMILTDDKEAYDWFKRARFDGRREKPLDKDKFDMLGWNMYLTPDQAERGLELFRYMMEMELMQEDLDVDKQNYPDLSQWGVYAK